MMFGADIRTFEEIVVSGIELHERSTEDSDEVDIELLFCQSETSYCRRSTG